jgi:hypothetical protein
MQLYSHLGTTLSGGKMKKFGTRLLCISIVVLILGGAVTGAFAQLFNYTGCLNIGKGKLRKLLRGQEPTKRCKFTKEVQIRLAAGDSLVELEANLAAINDLASGVDGRLNSVEQGLEEVAAELAAITDDNFFIGAFSTALGNDALLSEAALFNTAVGSNALKALSSADQGNTAIGADALAQLTFLNDPDLPVPRIGNTAVGWQALLFSQGSRNIALGARAGFGLSDGDENIYIGNEGESEEDLSIHIGTDQERTFIAGIAGANVADGVSVLVSSSGQLGTVLSSRRYKQDIQPLGELSRDLLRLRPVTFRYKEPDAKGKHPMQYGLIAEEVAEVYPDLVAYAKDGRPQTVKYHKLNSLLLNELQKQHQQIRQQEEVITKLVARLDRLEAKLAN